MKRIFGRLSSAVASAGSDMWHAAYQISTVSRLFWIRFNECMKLSPTDIYTEKLRESGLRHLMLDTYKKDNGNLLKFCKINYLIIDVLLNRYISNKSINTVRSDCCKSTV